MDKKAKAGNVALWIASISLVLMVGAVFYMGFVQETALPSTPAEVKEQVAVTAEALNAGKASTVYMKALNQESNSLNQVAPSLYVEEIDGNSGATLIKDATAMSTTATTAVATTVGSKLKATAFSSNFYGDFVEQSVSKETETWELPVYNISETLKSQCYDNAGNSIVIGSCNITLGASQEDYFAYIKLEVNTSDEAFNFGMLGIDTTANSNISDITVEGSVETNDQGSFKIEETLATPDRLRTTLDFQWVLSAPVMLHEWDSLKTPAIKIKIDADNPLETATVYFIDSQKFKSVKSATANQILSGVETDAASAADVGASDFTLAMEIK